MRIYLAVVTPYIVASSTLTTLYYGTMGFTTGPADTPANTYFEPRIKQAASMRRDMFGAGTTMGASRVGIGDLVLANGDGALDALLGYAFDGRDLTIYQGDHTGTFPTDFKKLLVGTVEQAEFTRDEVRLRIRDRQLELEKPLQSTLYAGNNSLPAGYEGVAGDLKGKPKPLLYGTVRNISPPCVNTSKLIYQVSEDAVDDISDVYDSGIELGSALPPDWDIQTLDVYSNYNTMYGVAYSTPLARWCMASSGVVWESDDADTWVSHWLPIPVATVPNWLHVIWGRGIFVASGDQGAIAYSPDAINWTLATSPFAASDTCSRVAYSASLDLYVVGATGGLLYYSSDAKTWTVAGTNPLSASANVNDIIWVEDLTLFVAVCDNNEIATSPDGDVWTARTSAHSGTPQLIAVDYSDYLTQLVVVGTAGATGKVQTSTNGTAWTEQTGLPTNANWRNVLWTPWNYWLVASWTPNIITSTDGATWTDRSAAAWNSSGIRGTATDGSVVVASGEDKKVGTATLGPNIVYSTLTDLADDTLAPPAGGYGVYLAGGLFRLGSTPAGTVTCDATAGDTAADRTAGQMWADVLTEKGMANLANLITSDNISSGWTSVGTPVVTASMTDPWGGSAAYTVADDNGAAVESKYIGVTFTGDGTKSFCAVVKEGTMPAAGVQTLGIWDNTASVWRGQCTITSWVSGVPQITAAVGTHVRTRKVRPGWYAIYFTAPSVTAANTNRFYIEPASTAANTGSITVYKVQAYNSADPEAHDWSWLDVLRLDNDDDSILGYWSGIEPVNASEVLSKIAGSVGAWWGVDREGVFRIQRLGNPSSETADISFVADDMVRHLERVPTADEGRGLPIWRQVIRYDKNYTVQTSDLAAGVTDANRAVLAQPWKETSDETASVKTAYLLAREQVDETLYTVAADALAEATRRLGLRDSRADRFEFAVPLDDDTIETDLGSFVSVTHDRFGLTSGRVFVCITVEPDAANQVLLLGLWGVS